MKQDRAAIAVAFFGLILSLSVQPVAAADYDVDRLILPPSPFAGDDFGTSITDLAGNIAIGVPNEQAGGPGDQAFDNGGLVYVFSPTSGELVRTFVSPAPADDANFGTAVANLAGNLLVGAPGEAGGGVVYLLDGTTGALLDTFQPAGLSASARFGESIAANGTLFVVGAPGDDVSGADDGSAHLCDSVAGTCTAITGPTLSSGAAFGTALAFAGSDVIVGAPGMSSSAGSVYLFTNGSTLSQTFSPGVTGQLFGSAVAWSGSEIFAGAPGDTGATGTAYACDPAGPTTCTERFLNPFADFGDQFGVAVASLGGDLLVGAQFGDEGTSDGGAGYLMDGTTGALVRTFFKSDAEALDNFGVAVADIAGDPVFGAIRHKVVLPFGAHLPISSGGAMAFDASTGTETTRFEKPSTIEFRSVIVADNRIFAACSVSEDPDHARIFVFDSSTGAIDYVIEPPPTDDEESFGSSQAHEGSQLLVGSPSIDTAYLLDDTTGAVLQTFAPTVASFSFGESTVFSEGQPVVGAFLENSGAGAAYRFNPSTGAQIHKLEESPTFAQRQLGRALAAQSGWLFAGGPSNAAFPEPGQVFAFDSTTGAELQVITSPTPASGGQFGNDVISVDGRIVVGALLEDSSFRGRAHVFAYNSGSGLWEVAHTASPNGSGIGNANFGRIMAPFGSIALIGSPGAAGSDGRVYVLDVHSGDVDFIARPSNRDAGFGSDVAADGDAWFVATAATQIGAVPADSSLAFYVMTATPVCGDGFVDAGEDCDGTECCSLSCTTLPAGSACSDDGDACTLDQCDAEGMCTHPHAPAGTACEDDGVECTLDQCDGMGTCEHPQAPDGTSCEDADACTDNDTCTAGVCIGGPPTDCDDSNPCTADSCISPTGCDYQPVSGTCSDGNQCTFNDLCSGGQCVGQCDVGAPCPLGPCGGTGECTEQGATCQCQEVP